MIRRRGIGDQLGGRADADLVQVGIDVAWSGAVAE